MSTHDQLHQAKLQAQAELQRLELQVRAIEPEVREAARMAYLAQAEEVHP
jgi:hypothetical protein